jgi:hypothetical protein
VAAHDDDRCLTRIGVRDDLLGRLAQAHLDATGHVADRVPQPFERLAALFQPALHQLFDLLSLRFQIRAQGFGDLDNGKEHEFTPESLSDRSAERNRTVSHALRIEIGREYRNDHRTCHRVQPSLSASLPCG